MDKYTFEVTIERLVGSSCFMEASREELRVLLAIIASRKCETSIEELSEISGASVARVKSAITLFEECGAIEKNDADAPLGEVIYEFEQRSDEIAKETRMLDTARTIRDENLRDMYKECEKILGKTLASYESGNLSKLCTEMGLTPEYVVFLTAHLANVRKKVCASRIIQAARELVENGIDTLEALEVYVEEKEKEVSGEAEMRYLFGIYGRSLTPSERKHFKRWLHEFGYSNTIIGEAYDICVESIGKLSLAYINTVLTNWHDAGCKTLEECRIQHNLHKSEYEKKAKKTTRKGTTPTAEVPKYTDFNSEDALMRALERSYGDTDENK